jgi:hypothetical protein
MMVGVAHTWHRRIKRRFGEALGPALAGIAMLPLCVLGTYLDHAEDRLLADAPVVVGVVTAEPVPILDRGQPLTVSFTTSRGERVEVNIEKYLVPARKKGQAIEIQYAYDGDDVYAREAGWYPDFWSRWFYLCFGIAGAFIGSMVLIVSFRRSRVTS